MHAFTILSTLLLGSTGIWAAPTAAGSDSSPNLTVLVRAEDGSYAPSDDMAKTVHARLSKRDSELSILSKRQSSGTVAACSSSDCTDCTTLYNGSFTNSGNCLAAANTACLVITNLENANVQYWSGTACTGRHTSYGTCGTATSNVMSPGTQSLAIQTGCL